MASNEKKLNIKDAISMCNYPINIRQSFVKFLENTYGLYFDGSSYFAGCI